MKSKTQIAKEYGVPSSTLSTWLKNKEVFLPPNTTSHTQPMDQGIIANLKHHYRSILLKQLIVAIDRGEPYVVSVLDAMRIIQRAWALAA